MAAVAVRMTIHDLSLSRTTADDAGEDLYRIGTVASMSGIAVERLRAWERRYGLTPAQRDGKTRFYSADQVERLKKLKALSDYGHPISSIVELSDQQLDARLASQRQPAVDVGTRIQIGLIGPNLLVLEAQQAASEQTQIAARWANMAAFCSDQQATAPLDVIVVQLPVLLDRHVDSISRLCPKSRIIAVYQFATPSELACVEERGIPTLEWPASWQDIEDTALASAVRLPQAGTVAGNRRFSDEDLIAIAVSAAEDETGATAHLVDLISQLNAFAEYSEEIAATDGVNGERFERVHADACIARTQLELALTALTGVDSEA